MEPNGIHVSIWQCGHGSKWITNLVASLDVVDVDALNAFGNKDDAVMWLGIGVVVRIF